MPSWFNTRWRTICTTTRYVCCRACVRQLHVTWIGLCQFGNCFKLIIVPVRGSAAWILILAEFRFSFDIVKLGQHCKQHPTIRSLYFLVWLRFTRVRWTTPGCRIVWGVGVRLSFCNNVRMRSQRLPVHCFGWVMFSWCHMRMVFFAQVRGQYSYLRIVQIRLATREPFQIRMLISSCLSILKGAWSWQLANTCEMLLLSNFRLPFHRLGWDGLCWTCGMYWMRLEGHLHQDRHPHIFNFKCFRFRAPRACVPPLI